MIRRLLMFAPVLWLGRLFAQTRLDPSQVAAGPPPSSGSQFAVRVRTLTGWENLVNDDGSLEANLTAKTIRAKPPSGSLPPRQEILVTTVNQTITLSDALVGGLQAMIFRNGQLLSLADYTVNGTAVAPSASNLDGWQPANAAQGKSADVISVCYGR